MLGATVETRPAGLTARVVRQFRQPTGAAGRLAGWIMATRPSNRLRNARTLELLSIAPGDTVLELGYGPGYALALACPLLREGRLIGIDHSPVMHSQAMRRTARAIASGKLSLLVGDVLELAAQLPRFDKIYSVNVVQFWHDPTQVFATLERLLAPGGTLATTYMPRVGRDKHRQANTKADELIVRLQRIGFERIETHWIAGRPAPAFCVLAKRGSRRAPGTLSQASAARASRLPALTVTSKRRTAD